MPQSLFVSKVLPASQLSIVGTGRLVQAVGFSEVWLSSRVMGDLGVALDLISWSLSWEFVTRSCSIRLYFGLLELGLTVLVSYLISWSSDPNIPRLEDTVEDGVVDGPALLSDTKFLTLIWRRHFHRNHLCCLFATFSKQIWELNAEQLSELKRLILHTQKTVPFSETSFGQHVCEFDYWSPHTWSESVGPKKGCQTTDQ